MKPILLRKFRAFIAAFVFCVSLLLPAHVVAQGNGHERGLTKKSQRFVNGHDARSGRWDGRGPRPRLEWTSRLHRRNRVSLIRRHRTHQRVRLSRIR